jgi:predicted flap endonuclease-1-like 5' DNA nuclease
VAWSFGHWLILIVALLVGLAAGWVLRGRRDAATAGSPSMDGGAAGGMTAVVAEPAPAATTDTVRPEATVDPAPAAVAEQPAPVDTVPAQSGPASPAANTVDPADMALTHGPVATPDPATDRGRGADEPAEADAALVAELAARDGEDGPGDEVPVSVPDTDRTDDEPAVVAQRPAPAAERAEDVAAAEPTTAEPVEADTAKPVEAETAAEPVDADATARSDGPVADEPPARPAVATPPVRPVPAPAPAAEAAGDAEPADDFRRIQGVGPKMAAALQAAGVRTYRQLAELDEAGLRDLIRAAGLRAAPGLATWPQQAKVLAGTPEAAAVLPAGGDDA